MEEQKRFQNRKPNKADHQGITNAVKGGKVVVGVLGAAISVGLAAKGNEDKIGDALKHIKKK